MNRGASVLVVESEGVVGGSSRLAGGQIMGAGSRVQACGGLRGQSRRFVSALYVAEYSGPSSPQSSVDSVTSQVPQSTWLADLGVQFYGQLFYSGDEAVPRDHVPETHGAGIINVLETHMPRQGRSISP